MLFDAPPFPTRATTAPTRTDVYLYQETDGESDETDRRDERQPTVTCGGTTHVEATKGEPFYMPCVSVLNGCECVLECVHPGSWRGFPPLVGLRVGPSKPSFYTSFVGPPRGN